MTIGPDRNGIARRLREGMDEKNLGAQALAERIRRVEPGLRGASKATIINHLNARIGRPNREMLRAAARVLRLNEDYLLHGTGERLVEAEAARNIVGQIVAETHDAIRRGFPAFDHLSPGAQGTVWRILQAVQVHLRRKYDQPLDHAALGKALAAPLQALSLDTGDLTRFQLDFYVIGTCSALAAVVAETGAAAA